MRIYEQAVRQVTEQGVPVWGAASLYMGLSGLYRERDDLEAATACLLRSKEQGEHAGLPATRHRGLVAMARIKEAHGDLDGALALLDQAERQQAVSPDPELRPVAALRARVWVAQGRLAEALGWVHERRLSADDDLSYLREFEHITLARVLLARSAGDRPDRSLPEAMALLERLLHAADAGGRIGSVIEILMLQAILHQAQGDIPTGLLHLERALSLAEPEGYVRTFVDEGTPMRDLLRHATAAGIGGAYARRLLAAFAEPTDVASAPPRVAVAGLAEPLTAREVEILRLVAAGLKNQAIADHLVISVATVKRHIANIYGKLAVDHRAAAIARARDLGLL
jgi:LuxR family maltose regulon positive regulatory protein